tara:strand:+ start:9897 stop:10841 length:945 start_codon:yes stop_codon:yes gene_type:complete
LKKKIIIDCDPGHDDAVAIMLAAANENLEILGITCVAGNATLENTKLNALKVCSLINRTDINVYAGSDKPIHHELVTAEHVHGKSGLDIEGEEILVDSSYKVQDLNAVDFIINTCHQSNDKIYLCPTGPLTNIALSLKKDPSIINKIKEIVFMGGAAMCLGNITPSAEFNIYVDPHAANIVLNSGVPITMIGLDVTHKVNVNDNIIEKIKSNNNKASIFFAKLMEFYSRFHRKLYKTNESPLHDPCVIGYLIDKSIFKGKYVNVQVEENSLLTRGKTVTDWLGVTNYKANCNVIYDANSKIFFDLLNKNLSKLN